MLDTATNYLHDSRRSFADRSEQYRLLIRAWRHTKQARTELDRWIYAPSSPPYKESKAEETIRISHIPIVDRRPHRTDYSLRDLDKIEDWLANGRDNLSADELFRIGWHFDAFERMIQRKIDWDKLHIRLIEEYQLS